GWSIIPCRGKVAAGLWKPFQAHWPMKRLSAAYSRAKEWTASQSSQAPRQGRTHGKAAAENRRASTHAVWTTRAGVKCDSSMNATGSDVQGNDAASAAVLLTPIERLLLTRAEASAALRISERLLLSKTKSREIPCVRIGRAVRYSAAALQEWLNSIEPD